MPHPKAVIKDRSSLKELGDSFETNPTVHSSFLTPTKDFFICADKGGTPLIDADTYTIKVEGDALETPLELTYDALLNLPSHTLIACLECAGSQRNLFKEVMDRPAQSENFYMTPWMLGGVGNAVWTGVNLKPCSSLQGLKTMPRLSTLKGWIQVHPKAA